MTGLIQKYRNFFTLDAKPNGPALPADYPVVSLNEGNTPLIPACYVADRIQKESGVTGLEIYLKFEGLNPTGSFKDRGMTMAVSQAKYQHLLGKGAGTIICASTGNTSAAAAAYGARAGLSVLVIIPEGKVALGKLSQAILYGARIVEIAGNFDQALTIVRELGETGKVEVVNSINPYRIEGQKTGAFEVCDELGDAPDYLFIPVGNAGNITAYWKGFSEYHQKGISKKCPQMFGYEAEGSAAIVQKRVIEHPETIATAIRIGNPASWQQAEAARDESGGCIDSVTDDEIIDAYRFLACHEGVFCEPASAASVAGLFKAAKQGQLKSGAGTQKIVCVLTGNGLKDPDNAIQLGKADHVKLPADQKAIADYLKLD